MAAHATSSAVGLTPQQAAAINTRAVSVALSAGAGCGKTFVLTRRFLSHLDPNFIDERYGKPRPAELSQLVAITFTERAAREMRDRIRAETLRRLREADEQGANYWLDLWRGLEGARIGTFHAFCAALLRSHAVEARLDPGFLILEESTTATLTAEAAEDVLRATLTEGLPAALATAGEFGIEVTLDRLKTLWSSAREHDAALWNDFDPPQLLAHWRKVHQQQFAPMLIMRWRELDSVTLLRDYADRLTDLDKAADEHRRTLLAAIDFCSAGNLDPQSLTALRQATMMKVRAKNFADEAQYARYKDLCTVLRGEVDKLLKLAEPPGDDSLRSAEASLRLWELVPRFDGAYQAAKTRERGLDFTDLQLAARRLLNDPAHTEVRKRLTGNLKLLLVDECQDTDPIQRDILQALAGNAAESEKLFLVGDFKQSIYRFRGADPRVFTELRQAVPTRGRLPLSLNFRSQPGVIDFVNALFNGVLDTTNEPYEPLQAKRPATTDTNVEFLWSPGQSGRGATLENRSTEATWIARRLRQILDDGEPLIGTPDGGARPVRYGDIALLFRTLSNVQLYESALRDAGLPYYLVGGHAFYAQQEIHDLLNLLRAVQSPADEIALAGALRSPIFGLTDDQLFFLVRKPGGLNRGLLAADSRAADPAIDQAASVLTELRQRKDRIPIADLIRRALELTQYDAVLAAEFLGERKLANLEKLLDSARSFDRAGTLSLPDFLVQLTEQVAEEPREAPAATHPENTDVIKLLTIHKSKGLEFPLVLVPDLDRPRRADSSTTAFDPMWGPMTRVDGVERDALSYHKALLGWEDDAEQRRLFYVATTRAADYLILSAALADQSTAVGPWTRQLSARFDLTTGKYHAPGHTLSPPRIRVTTVEPPQPTAVTGESRVRPATIVKELQQAKRPRGASAEERQIAPVPPRPERQLRFAISRLAAHVARVETTNTETDPAADETVRYHACAWAFDAAPTNGPLDAPTYESHELGKLVHAVLARLTGERARHWTAEDWQRELQQTATTLELHRDELLAPARTLLQRFAEHERFTQLRTAREFRTEVEFLLPWPAVEARRGPRRRDVIETDTVPYLLGYLDCLVCDAVGDWWVWDYKTNRLDGGEAALAEALSAYRPQLETYCLAVEQALGVAPRGAVLHFLATGQETVFQWNRDRARAISDWLTAAIRAARNEPG